MSMNGTIRVCTFPSPPVDRREILRYAGVRGDVSELDGLLDECIEESAAQLTYKVCWREFEITERGNTLDLGIFSTDSADLRRNLRGCKGGVVFAATVGIGLDRLIARYGSISPTRALLLQAIGAERIEALCDAFNNEITARAKQNGQHTRPRFSPGYGDLPLEAQREFFSALDCSRKIGLTLNESLLMSPSKSVTAIIGTGDSACQLPEGCGACNKKDCVFGEHNEDN